MTREERVRAQGPLARSLSLRRLPPLPAAARACVTSLSASPPEHQLLSNAMTGRSHALWTQHIAKLYKVRRSRDFVCDGVTVGKVVWTWLEMAKDLVSKRNSRPTLWVRERWQEESAPLPPTTTSSRQIMRYRCLMLAIIHPASQPRNKTVPNLSGFSQFVCIHPYGSWYHINWRVYRTFPPELPWIVVEIVCFCLRDSERWWFPPDTYRPAVRTTGRGPACNSRDIYALARLNEPKQEGSDGSRVRGSWGVSVSF